MTISDELQDVIRITNEIKRDLRPGPEPDIIPDPEKTFLEPLEFWSFYYHECGYQDDQANGIERDN